MLVTDICVGRNCDWVDPTQTTQSNLPTICYMDAKKTLYK